MPGSKCHNNVRMWHLFLSADLKWKKYFWWFELGPEDDIPRLFNKYCEIAHGSNIFAWWLSKDSPSLRQPYPFIPSFLIFDRLHKAFLSVVV